MQTYHRWAKGLFLPGRRFANRENELASRKGGLCRIVSFGSREAIRDGGRPRLGGREVEKCDAGRSWENAAVFSWSPSGEEVSSYGC